MKRIQLAFLAAAFATLSWTGAFAEGALAIGQPANIAKNGVAIGLSTDFPTKKAASRDALAQCKRSNVKAATRALCKVVGTFTGQCVAIALDPKVGTPGFGWGLARSAGKAKTAAVIACNKVAGPTRQGACRVVGYDCD